MSEPRILRPMEYGEIFNEAFDLYKRNFGLFAGICAVVYIPFSLVMVLLGRSPLVGALLYLVSLVPLIAATGAIVKALADRYLGHEVTIAGSWSYVLRRLVPFVLTSLLAGLMVMSGIVLASTLGVLAWQFLGPSVLAGLLAGLMVVLGLLFGVIALFWIFFVWSVMIVEDRFYISAIRRSRELAAGNWLRILVIVGLTLALTWGVALIVFLMLAPLVGVQTAIVSSTAPTAADLPLWVDLVAQLLNGVLSSIVTPITTLLGVLLYFDVRVRKEGFDVELLAREMGEGPAGAGPGMAPA